MSDDNNTEDDRRERRLERDRINARERRKRRKLLVQDLETNVSRLSMENVNLKTQNNMLYQELCQLNQEVSKLRQICSMIYGVSQIDNGVTTPQRDARREMILNQSPVLGMNNPNLSLISQIPNSLNAANLSMLTQNLPQASNQTNSSNQIDKMSPTVASILASQMNQVKNERSRNGDTGDKRIN